MSLTKRKVVQFQVMPSTESLYVLCDDGTLWCRDYLHLPFARIPTPDHLIEDTGHADIPSAD